LDNPPKNWQGWIEKLKAISRQLKRELQVYRLLLKHPETPLLSKILLGLAVGYLLLPFDLIPDFIPIIGQLDDVILIPLLVYLAHLQIPKSLIQQCREEVNKTI
jgi:uncharacterized membrane protein YkvA (DUF1232 family)